MPLSLGPAGLGLIEHRHIRDVVESQQREPPRPPHVERDGDHDPTQPARESGRLLQIPEATKRPQVGLLGRILGDRRITQDAERDRVDHRLRRLHQPSKGLEVAALGSNDEIVQGLHLQVIHM